MSLGPNRVELAGTVVRLNGGTMRRGGYWLLLNIEVTEDEERSITLPVWWFGESSDYDVYKGVAEGDEIEVVGEVRWGKNRDDEWELRIVAFTLGVTSDRRNGRNRERRESSERRESNGRNGRQERRGRKEQDEEVPF